MPDATSEETLKKDEFQAKWGMVLGVNHNNPAYTEACMEANKKGYWLAPDGSRWTKTGKNKSVRWTQKTPATV